MKFTRLEWAAWIFILIGAINWGLVGAFSFNLVDTVFGTAPVLVRIVYVLVGLAGLFIAFKLRREFVKEK